MDNFKLPLLPEDMNNCFAKAYNSGKAENLIQLFEQNAKSITIEGSVLSGLDKIREDHRKLLSLGGKMTSINKFCIQFENIALLKADWGIKTLDSEGKEIEIKDSSSEVIRKQSDGTWLYVIDHPFASHG